MQKLVLLLTLATILIFNTQSCVHDTFALNTTKHFLNDLSDKRLLSEQQVGRLRVFVDYSLLTVGGVTQINTIKRVINITANYFYSFLNVTRLERLYFPKSSSRICNSIQVPQQYVINGTIGDVGVVCTNEFKKQAIYVAKSTPCAFLESNKRPIWGMMSFNNAFLKFDQVGFQEVVFIAIHQMIHILGFSALLYEFYPGKILVTGPNGEYYLNSPKIQEQIKKHYGCDNFLGFPLEDQDGTLLASHWQKKAIGNQIMISSVKKGAFLHPVTAALFESTGFYQSVNYAFVQPVAWGKNKGCDFLNIDMCQGEQFCQASGFDCDAQATGIGKCSVDPYTGSCKLQKYFTNTICVDENYETKNLNAKLNALQRGGASSKCFNSDFRQQGVTKTKLDFRCYTSVCSSSGKFIYLMVGSFVLICRSPGQKLAAPPGLQGTLTCPSKFQRYCQSKKSCPYHCNKNGACIDGKCLCTASTQFTTNCIDISIYLAPAGSTGGLLTAIVDSADVFSFDNDNQNATKPNGTNLFKKKEVKQYSFDSKCIQGTFYDPMFGQCLKCREVYKCQQCNESGCLVCDNGKRPIGNRCSL